MVPQLSICESVDNTLSRDAKLKLGVANSVLAVAWNVGDFPPQSFSKEKFSNVGILCLQAECCTAQLQ